MSPFGVRMIELMYIYQQEYKCMDCSRVKYWVSEEELKEDVDWHL